MIDRDNSLINKIFFTLFAIVVFRVGSFIPIPGINPSIMKSFAYSNKEGILGMFNVISGGSLSRMSVFALAIMPYITSSIIIQLLSSIYTPLEDLKKEGQAGRRKIGQLSRYLTIVLASVQAYGISIGLLSIKTELGPIVNIGNNIFITSTVLTLVVGTTFLMWMGEQITDRGVGNGISVIIFAGIVSNLPSSFINLFELVKKGAISNISLLSILVIILAVLYIVVVFEKSYRKILVCYPNRSTSSRKFNNSTSTHIPLKINTSGVIPPIFAGSILLFPATISGFSSIDDSSFISKISMYLAHGKPLYILLYIILIIFFSFFYTSIVFNTVETADNLKKSGAYLPGYRPGKNTAEYFDNVLTKLTVIGSVYLSVVCIVPEVLINNYSISFALGGTTFLIIVNVILDTAMQIQTHMFSKKYEAMTKRIRV
ncbi:MAG TPA: preprotein translocase subunit SecY [Candidatus Megaira endosymbiont of Hartmannula sinica]|nr:preprotein translocase subunit SecY [Candidatus Megaera endosymbiont of Hartmannula sinica]